MQAGAVCHGALARCCLSHRVKAVIRSGVVLCHKHYELRDDISSVWVLRPQITLIQPCKYPNECLSSIMGGYVCTALQRNINSKTLQIKGIKPCSMHAMKQRQSEESNQEIIKFGHCYYWITKTLDNCWLMSIFFLCREHFRGLWSWLPGGGGEIAYVIRAFLLLLCLLLIETCFETIKTCFDVHLLYST